MPLHITLWQVGVRKWSSLTKVTQHFNTKVRGYHCSTRCKS